MRWRRAFCGTADGGRAALRQALGSTVIDLSYVTPFTGDAMELADAIELSRFWRKMIDLNRGIAAAVGFALWKRPTVAALLWDGTSNVPFVPRPAAATPADQVAIWKSRTDPATLHNWSRRARLIEVEDASSARPDWGQIASLPCRSSSTGPASISIQAAQAISRGCSRKATSRRTFWTAPAAFAS